MRKAALLTLVAVFALVGVALAAGDDQERGDRGPAAEAQGQKHRVAGPARKACKAERAADPAAFQEKYANKKGKRAGRRCVRQHVRSARRACRAKRAADPAAFRAKYANENGRRAGRRCVRQHSGDPVT